MSINPGHTLIATGILHCAIGLTIPQLRQPLFSAIRASFINKLSPDMNDIPATYSRMASWWFLQFGVMLSLFGATTLALIDEGKGIPVGIAWSTIVLSAIGAIGNP
ncbi:UNVERIFIED_CONTAM: hypothetical protein HDU68_003170, partial [Siphonaria sp. JEL0065]